MAGLRPQKGTLAAWTPKREPLEALGKGGKKKRSDPRILDPRCSAKKPFVWWTGCRCIQQLASGTPFKRATPSLVTSRSPLEKFMYFRPSNVRALQKLPQPSLASAVASIGRQHLDATAAEVGSLERD